MLNSKWINRFGKLAREVSTWSKDPSTQIGAVIVNDDRNILSLGYNGYPKGIPDDDSLMIREEKYKKIVHAEMNAIYNALANGVGLKNSTLIVYGLPVCEHCILGVIQVGIKDVYCFIDFENKELWNRWKESTQNASRLFHASGYEKTYNVLNKKELD